MRFTIPYATAYCPPMTDMLFRLYYRIFLLKWQGYERASLAVQKANYAVKMYTDLGFKMVKETDEEYVMVCEL